MLKKTVSTAVLLAASLGATAAVAADESDISKGRDVYEQRCLHCHGDNADGKGHLIEFLKVTPANLTKLSDQGKGCITERVLKAVLGRHSTAEHKMPLLKEYLSPEEVYFVSSYIKSVQK